MPTSLLDALAKRLARDKLPRARFVVDAPPRRAMAMIDQKSLRAAYADAFASGSEPSS